MDGLEAKLHLRSEGAGCRCSRSGAGASSLDNRPWAGYDRCWAGTSRCGSRGRSRSALSSTGCFGYTCRSEILGGLEVSVEDSEGNRSGLGRLLGTWAWAGS